MTAQQTKPAFHLPFSKKTRARSASTSTEPAFDADAEAMPPPPIPPQRCASSGVEKATTEAGVGRSPFFSYALGTAEAHNVAAANEAGAAVRCRALSTPPAPAWPVSTDKGDAGGVGHSLSPDLFAQAERHLAGAENGPQLKHRHSRWSLSLKLKGGTRQRSKSTSAPAEVADPALLMALALREAAEKSARARLKPPQKHKPRAPPPRSLEDIPITTRQVVLCQYIIRKFLKRRIAERRMKIRQLVVEELVTTERTYVSSLIELIRTYYLPLKQAEEENSSILTREEFSSLFANVFNLFQLNQQLLQELEQRISNWTADSCIGDVFMKLAPFFKLYVSYCANHSIACETLTKLMSRSSFSSFIKKAAKQNVGSSQATDHFDQSLASSLILPVQRIPRYQLFFKQLVEYTPSSHSDEQNVRLALEEIVTVARRVNDGIRERQERDLCSAIRRRVQGCPFLFAETRHFVREGLLTKVCHKVDKQGYFFLFTDCLVYTTPTNVKDDSAVQLSFRKLVSLLNSSATCLSDARLPFSFRIVTPAKSFTVAAGDATERDAWLDDITAACAAIGDLPGNKQPPEGVPEN
eukprot:TRINITY_DN5134_c0_g1_i4.p1 TRINITY_DN5134_c0_g1~~TRINITY_DN5134_c0_g1_i4.p1  ORF type:complete len:582 (+),score=121.54 TRINITY_DN5134_c0_g1_i4:46-1791(+)